MEMKSITASNGALFGLGTDNKVYRWNIATIAWELYQQKISD
jgi:hypothetical protein